jgi:hypothetical protein
VGGCNASNISESDYNASLEGGVTNAFTNGSAKEDGKAKVVLNVDARLEPRALTPKFNQYGFITGTPEFVINKETVYDSWTKNPNTRNTNLVLPGQTGYSPHDFIGFAPTINGEVNNFDSKSLTWGSGSSRKIGKVWEAWEALSMSDAQISDATSICENPSERQMMQYRSYNQKPYFYLDKLCQQQSRMST